MGVIYSLLGLNDSGVPDPVTGLTDREIKFVQNSWAKLMENPTASGLAIMTEFFTKFPDNLKYFPFRDVPLEKLKDETRFKVHCNTVMYGLGQIIDNLKDSEIVIASLDKLASNHAKRNVTSQGFEDIKSVLLGILAAKFSKDTYEAWKKMLDLAIAHTTNQLT